ncbi:MAG: hypothetical protein PHV17_07045 [Candidatus Omnitrophica bacterium]|nr:hypothetical protein [Candidatus Omnitrophota bacterium]
MTLLKAGKRHGQSVVEYTLLLALTVAVLLSVGRYFERGVQGHLKQQVDRLGGEKLLDSKRVVYTPGKWYTYGDSSSVVRTTTSGFSYEGRKGFGISTSGFQRTERSSITGLVTASDLRPDTVTNGGLLDNQRDQDLMNRVRGSSFDPGMDIVENGVGSGTEITQNTATNETLGDTTVGDFESLEDFAGDIPDDYIDRPDPQSVLP